MMFARMWYFPLSWMAALSPVENYIRSHKWNQDLLSSLEDDYEIVYPFQVRDRNRVGIETRNYYYTNATYHFESATFVIRSSFKRFKLHLRLNQELIPDGAAYRSQSSRTPSRGVTNCYYQGLIHNEPLSAVALSSCFGLRGVLFSENDTYVMIPLKGGDSGRRHPHLFYRASWHRKAACANGDRTEWSRSLNRRHRSRHRRDSEQAEKFLELAVVADYNLAAQYDFDFNYLLSATLEAVNIVDLIYHKGLNTRVSLVSVEAWMERNVITLSGDMRQTLLNFLEYSSRELYRDHKDAILFLTPHRFSRRESSMSTSGTVCTAKAAGVVQMGSEFRVHESAVTMVHNIGHLLGMTHEAHVLSLEGFRVKGEGFAWSFSRCSQNEYLSLLSSGKSGCLFNKPLQESRLNMCGNKMVDVGEECDCGSIEECESIDPCCDPVTCRLKSDAQCASGPCCDGCKLKAEGEVCREAVEGCDVPEQCDGKSGQCPADSRLLNGAPCDEGEGVCYLGKCRTRNQQCAAIWGQGSLDSESECYEQFNILGFQHGHCGRNEDGSYVSCDLRNVKCGLLHCRNGSDTIQLDSAGDSLKTKIESGEDIFECKSVTERSVGMVVEGGRCGSDGICLSGSCVPMMDIISPTRPCPTNNLALDCSGHGACTTENWCYCNDGWSGRDCGMRSPVKKRKPPSGPPFVPQQGFGRGNAQQPFDEAEPSKLDVSSMLIILGGVGGGIVLLLLFLLLCYRRRTSSALRKKKLAARIDADRASESSVDTAHRSIKFGSMPSYRDEKLRMKKKQRRTLHKIHEVSDERDSVSNKSRESGEPGMRSSQTPNSSHSEKGILKQAGGECLKIRSPGSNSEQDITAPLLIPQQTPSADGGYESEPPTYTAYRIFEKSLRKLDEYECSNPYHVPVSHSSGGTPVLIRSPQSEYWGHTSRGHIFVHRNHNSRPPPHPFSPPAARQSLAVPVRRARGGYATDTEVGYTPELTRRSSQESSSGGSPHSSWRQNLSSAGRESDADRASPTTSLASSRQPQPLKLENIEYLLKQLDTNLSTSLSPASSAEFSATEADKCAMEEEEAAAAMEANDCRFQSYSASAVQSFNCHSLMPSNDVSRYSNGSTERAGSS